RRPHGSRHEMGASLRSGPGETRFPPRDACKIEATALTPAQIVSRGAPRARTRPPHKDTTLVWTIGLQRVASMACDRKRGSRPGATPGSRREIGGSKRAVPLFHAPRE